MLQGEHEAGAQALVLGGGSRATEPPFQLGVTAVTAESCHPGQGITVLHSCLPSVSPGAAAGWG